MRTFSKLIFVILLFCSLNIYGQYGNPVYAKNGMVVSASTIASDVGIEILKKGGNAIDAAVATGFALAVTYPSAGNLGGGGFMVIHLANGKNTSIDFRETAPYKAFEKMFLDSLNNFKPELSTDTWLAAGVPGTVAGLIYALNKYGTMSLEDVIEPAIELAEDGIVLDYRLAESINYFHKDFLKTKAAKDIFTNNGNKLSTGDKFVQKDLANTLELISDYGADAFYKGKIAKMFVAASDKHGGLFTLKDLEDYRPIEKEVISANYKDYQIISMPPPSSGGICMIEALNVLAHYNFNKEDWGSSKYIHTLVEILKRVYADRSEHLGDPSFVNVPSNFLLSKEYASQIKDQIKEIATPSSQIKAVNIPVDSESKETTHYSVVDKFGNAVSTTYTINGSYGTRIVVDGLGFLLNNEMDDFSAKPGVPNQFGLIGSNANSIQPKKRMLSSMTPTIVLKDQKPFLVVGSPGGSTIITSVLQVILNVLDFKMNIYQAIESPRIHHQYLPDKIDYEPYGITEDVKMALLKLGHKFSAEEVKLGRVEGIMVDINKNCFWGTTDPRGFGKAAGY